MTSADRGAERSRRVVSTLAIALALAWSVVTHLLWQVELRTTDGQPPEVRWVFSALEPSAWLDGRTGDTPGKAPRCLAQPVLPDGESPAPCQIRRSCSPDAEVLAARSRPGFAAPAERMAVIRTESPPGVRNARPNPPLTSQPLPPFGCAPRPPPAGS